MAFIIQSPHQNVSTRTKLIVREKFERLNTLYDRIEQYHIVLKREKNDKQENFIVKVRLSVPGNDLFAMEQAESFAAAAENVCLDLEKQIRKLKTKLDKRVTGKNKAEKSV